MFYNIVIQIICENHSLCQQRVFVHIWTDMDVLVVRVRPTNLSHTRNKIQEFFIKAEIKYPVRIKTMCHMIFFCIYTYYQF